MTATPLGKVTLDKVKWPDLLGTLLWWKVQYNKRIMQPLKGGMIFQSLYEHEA